MTKLFDKAVEVARALPADMQDEIARVVLDMARADHDVVEVRGPDQLSAVLEGLFKFDSASHGPASQVEAALRTPRR